MEAQDAEQGRREAALVAAAREARGHAYAPHSGFCVGAALLTRAGEVVTGCNVENASYGLTLCAERVAATRAIAAGRGHDFVTLAVIADCARPVPPCGACRQFLYELAPDLVVLSATLGGEVQRATLRTLLPDAFDAGFLDRARAERGAR